MQYVYIYNFQFNGLIKDNACIYTAFNGKTKSVRLELFYYLYGILTKKVESKSRICRFKFNAWSYILYIYKFVATQ